MYTTVNDYFVYDCYQYFLFLSFRYNGSVLKIYYNIQFHINQLIIQPSRYEITLKPKVSYRIFLFLWQYLLTDITVDQRLNNYKLNINRIVKMKCQGFSITPFKMVEYKYSTAIFKTKIEYHNGTICIIQFWAL